MQGLGPTLADAMIATTAATCIDSIKLPPGLVTSYPDTGLPDPAVIATQAASLAVLAMLVREQKLWQQSGRQAVRVGIGALSHAVCLTLACRESCKDATYSLVDTREDLSLEDYAPYLSMTRKAIQLTFQLIT